MTIILGQVIQNDPVDVPEYNTTDTPTQVRVFQSLYRLRLHTDDAATYVVYV